MDDKKGINMKTIDIKRLKEIQVELLNSVADFCEENDIEYFLGYGTLIGAVRHKGFIPWDDDIDLIMKRDDYELFIKTFNEEGKSHKVYTHKNTEWYPFPYAKISDEKTVLKEENDNLTGEIGVNIDLFPVDYMPKDKRILKKIKIQYNMLMLKSIKINDQRSLAKNIILRTSKVLFKGKSAHSIARKIDEMAVSSNEKTKLMGNIVFTEKVTDYAKASAFEAGEKAEFEGRMYTIPQGYHEWLTNFYGDYMALPPVESRVTHHTFMAYEK